MSGLIKTSHQAKVWHAHGDGCEECRALGPTELEAIVRDLAEFDPAPRSNAYYCSMCGEHTADDISLHTDGCAYARAVMWVSAHPVSGDQR